MTTGRDVSKEELCIELDQKIKACDTGIEQIEPEIQRAKDRVKRFNDDRRRAIRAAVERLLPDVMPNTIKAVETRFPAAGITLDLLQRQLSEEERSIRGRYRDVEKESRSALVHHQDLARSNIRTTRVDLESARDAFIPLQSIPELERLVEAGYGTRAYSLDRSFFKLFSLQWWSDWRVADEIVAQLKVRDWAAVRQAYELQANAVSIIEQSLRGHEADDERYQQIINRIDERDGKIEKIKATLLERFQTKLHAWIDTWDGSVANAAPELSRLDAELTRLDQELASLEEARGQLVGERAKLINLKSRMRSSSKRFAPALLASRFSAAQSDRTRSATNGAGPRASGGVRHILVDRPTSDRHGGFLDGMLYQQMMDHFTDPPQSSPSYGGGGSSSFGGGSRGGYSGGSSTTSHDRGGSSSYDRRGWS